MLVALWGVRGGSGVTTTAAALAVVMSSDRHVLAVDLAGDLPELLPAAGAADPGVAEWLRAGAGRPRLGLWPGRTVPAGTGLELAPRGLGHLDGGRAALAMVRELEGESREVIIDCGMLGVGGLEPSVRTAGHVLSRGAHRSVLVTRACRLSMRRLVTTPVRCTHVIVVREEGRAVGLAEVEDAADAPVVAVVPWDAAVARAVDAGGFAGGVPASLTRALIGARERLAGLGASAPPPALATAAVGRAR
jgi:hypothetical protein